MSRGEIVSWDYNNEIDNGGTILRCFDGRPFDFSLALDEVGDAFLAGFLRDTRRLRRHATCSNPSPIYSVLFEPFGERARRVVRLIR